MRQVTTIHGFIHRVGLHGLDLAAMRGVAHHSRARGTNEVGQGAGEEIGMRKRGRGPGKGFNGRFSASRGGEEL